MSLEAEIEPQEVGTTALVLEARDLDTDDRSRTTLPVPRPRNAGEERRMIEEAAANLHPNAKLRSFANGAATFLDRQHLVVAFFLDARAARRTSVDQDSSQEQLFA
jgi:hypothetical protein